MQNKNNNKYYNNNNRYNNNKYNNNNRYNNNNKYNNKIDFDPDNLKLKNFYEYKITVKTLTPIFIGSGEELNKTMYVYDNKTNKVSIIHKERLYSFLESKELFEKFSEDCMKENFSISDFFNGIDYDDSIFKYSLEYRDNNIINNNKDSLNSINTFVKSCDVPYIPGSSIKGAIRTAIIANAIIENKDKLKFYMKDKSIRQMSNLEDEIIKKYILKDKFNKNKLFNSIHVSDSNPIPIYCDEKNETSNFFIGSRYDYSLKSKDINAMSIQLEFLKPDTIFTFNLSIDRLLSNVFDIKYIIDSLNKYFNIYKKTIDLFSNALSITKNQYHAYRNSENANIFIGGHNGYFTKNIIYSIAKFHGDKEGIEIKDIVEKIKRHIRKDEEDCYEEICPRTLRFTKYDDIFYDIGICSIEKIEEIKI
ncbi:type III-A CRISPR-associated RAMP protein Csm5 [Brachyspira intermedia]|uniref:type III-A CRISPR-associated RAMP protein Csm5 n=1 Tax=Brachyspira intermedia TaxID=84377 RepID=UPI003007AFFC